MDFFLVGGRFPLFFNFRLRDFFLWFFFFLVLSSGSRSHLLKREPSHVGRERGDQQQREAARDAGRGRRPVAARAQFKQALAEVQVPGLLFQLLPNGRRSLLTVRQRCGRARVEVVPVAGGRRKRNKQHNLYWRPESVFE